MVDYFFLFLFSRAGAALCVGVSERERSWGGRRWVEEVYKEVGERRDSWMQCLEELNYKTETVFTVH
jgi:hypothetical protein